MLLDLIIKLFVRNIPLTIYSRRVIVCTNYTTNCSE